MLVGIGRLRLGLGLGCGLWEKDYVTLHSALKSGPVPVLGLSGLGPWTGPVLIFPNMEGPRTGPHKTGFTWSWAVLGRVLVKTDS